MKNDLDKLRREIDGLDNELIEILAKRMEIVKKIGVHKKTYNIAFLDEKRWQQVLESRLSQAKSLQLPEQLIKKLYQIIHKHSLKIEGEK